MTGEDSKTCPDCGIEKPPTDFYVDRRHKTGRTTYCRPCLDERNKRSYRKHRKQRLAKGREWSQRNSKRRNEISRAYQERHRERYQAYRAEYRERNRQQLRDKWQAWASENNRDPEAARRAYARRRALEAEAYVEDVPFDDIVQRDLGICGICGEPVIERTVELDHIVPYVRGGLHEKKNVQLAHRTCNREKSGRLNYTKRVLTTTP